jgi:hypothetical protein
LSALNRKDKTMALTLALTYKGINLATAYYRVVGPQIDFSKNTMSFGVWPFSDQASATDAINVLGDAAVTITGAPYSISGVNVFQQAYDYLKTLSEFSGATDVLETGQPQT